MAITFHPNGKIDGLNNNNFRASMPSGSVLQVVKATKTNSTQISANSTWTDVGLEVSITPKLSNSLIYLLLTARCGNDTSSSNGIRVLKDGATVIMGNNDYMHNFAYNIGGNRPVEDFTEAFFNSPNTTSAVTYKVQCRITNGHFTFYGRGGETNAQKDCYLIATEISQ